MMDRDDIAHPSDIPAALGLLSRLPLGVDIDRATARGAKAAWAYPVAGLIIAVLACLVGQMTIWLGAAPALTAGLVLAACVIMTGAMHEDGLADTADGLWGGWDKARRLEIMKDSHIGAYGVIALVIGLGLRWQALVIVVAADVMWGAVMAAAILSRAVMVPVMARLPHARDTGLSHMVGRPSIATARLAEAVGAFATLVLFGLSGLWLIGVAALGAFECAAIARHKLGGQTGDILGATQQITEIALLFTLTLII
jgi:adenosylcobinamide-GDP ribazoletransferase